jgi:hypothetical protein
VSTPDLADIDRRIRNAEERLAVARAEVAALEAELNRLRTLAGRRPGDGSDQPRLPGQWDRQPSLFGG